MKAITYHKFGPPEALQLREVEKPIPTENEVRIRIHAAAVTSTDCVARSGFPLISRLAFGLFRPKQSILGTEFAGEVDAVGSAVRRFKIGDSAFAASGVEFGAYAEYICLPEDGAIAEKPDRLSYEEAAALCEGGLTALPFIRDEGKVGPGQKVLVNGASGAIGTIAVQLAKYYGAEVTGVCSSRNVELVRSLGADSVIDYTREDFTQAGEAYDVIFDTVGKSSFSRCKRVLKPEGIYLLPVLTLGILGQMLWTSSFGSKKAKIAFTGLRPPHEKTADLQFLAGLAETDKIKPVVGAKYPLEQMAEAHRHVETGHKRGSAVALVIV